MNKHTPAPWYNEDDQISAQVPGDGESYIAPICYLDLDWTDEMNTSNARLIAAAPELLEALKWILDCCELNLDDMEENTRASIKIARAAIAKAEQP